MKKIGWQFIKEFSVPFVCAGIYVASAAYWPSTGYGQYIRDFGLAFFFVSWFSGNLVRIWRTDKTQNSLKDIQSALSAYEAASSSVMKANNTLLEEIANPFVNQTTKHLLRLWRPRAVALGQLPIWPLQITLRSV